MDKRYFAALIVFEILILIIFHIIYFNNSTLSFQKHTDQYMGSSEQCKYNINLSPLNIINSASDGVSLGVEWSICQLSFVIDNYIAYTPDLLSLHPILADGTILSVSARDTLIKYTIPLAFLLLPLIIVVYAFKMSLSAFSYNPSYSLTNLITKGIFTLCIITALPVLLSFLILFNNALCKYIIVNMISPKSDFSLTSQIVNVINISKLDVSIIPSFINNILLIGLFIALLLMVFQFIIRYIIIWIFVLISPLLLIFKILPFCEGIVDGIIQKLILILFIQPVFLIGLVVFFQITSSSEDPITKLIIGVCSLLSLSLLPGFISGLSGKGIFSLGHNFTLFQWDFLLKRIMFAKSIIPHEGVRYVDYTKERK